MPRILLEWIKALLSKRSLNKRSLLVILVASKAVKGYYLIRLLLSVSYAALYTFIIYYYYQNLHVPSHHQFRASREGVFGGE